MKRLMTLSLGVLLLAAPLFAHEKGAAPKSKSLWAAGTVTAVSPGSLTVKGKGGEWTFAVDRSTTVSANGAGRKMAAMQADKKPAVLTAFVKTGDDVNVRYHDMGATRRAAMVSVRRSLPAPYTSKK